MAVSLVLITPGSLPCPLQLLSSTEAYWYHNRVLSKTMPIPELHDLIDRYTTFLRVEKNVSAHTLRNYLSDLLQFFAFVEKPREQEKTRSVVVRQIDHHLIHAFLSTLH